MPSTYDLPRASEAYSEQDQNLYQKLPYHLASMTSKIMPKWHIWDKLYGKRTWQQNQGTTLRTVNAEPSPIGRQQFFPNAITALPNRDVHETRERTEEAVIYRHNYESKYISFLGSFQDFRRNQIPFALKDLAMQITTANDMFVRTHVFHKVPHVLISGKGVTGAADGFDGDDFVAAPSGIGNAAGTTAKTTAWIQQALSYVGNNLGNLSYKLVKKAASIMNEDLQVPAFEGMQNMPKPNEQIKGKFVLIGSNEALEFMEFDEYVQSYQQNNVRIEDAEFSGKIGNKIVYKSERFPLRIANDGTFPAPQVVEGNADNYNYGETVPNPDYINAPYEVAFLQGAGAFESIAVGPPPSEFASGKMSSKKFAELKWNGEVRLTDNILINIGTEAAPSLVTNKYGEYVQLIADTVHGCIAVNRRHAIAIIYRRARVTTS